MTTQKSINLSNYYIRKNGETRDLSTQSKDGLMSKEDKTKLDGVATQANNYSHPNHRGYECGLYKITTNTLGHVISAAPVTKQDITSLGIADISAVSSTLSYQVMPGTSSVSEMHQAASDLDYSGNKSSKEGDIFQWYFEEVKHFEPEENIIYLLRNEDGHFNEYLCTYDNDEYIFELLGSTEPNLTNYIQKSSTSGLIKNDGTIDTNTYLTQHQTLPTIINDLTTGGTTSVLSAEQGKTLNTNKEEVSHKVSSWSATPSDDNYPSEKLVYDSAVLVRWEGTTSNFNSNFVNTSSDSNYLRFSRIGKLAVLSYYFTFKDSTISNNLNNVGLGIPYAFQPSVFTVQNAVTGTNGTPYLINLDGQYIKVKHYESSGKIGGIITGTMAYMCIGHN